MGLAVTAMHAAPEWTCRRCVAEACGCLPSIAQATGDDNEHLARRAQPGEVEIALTMVAGAIGMRDGGGLGARDCFQSYRMISMEYPMMQSRMNMSATCERMCACTPWHTHLLRHRGVIGAALVGRTSKARPCRWLQMGGAHEPGAAVLAMLWGAAAECGQRHVFLRKCVVVEAPCCVHNVAGTTLVEHHRLACGADFGKIGAERNDVKALCGTASHCVTQCAWGRTRRCCVCRERDG